MRGWRPGACPQRHRRRERAERRIRWRAASRQRARTVRDRPQPGRVPRVGNDRAPRRAWPPRRALGRATGRNTGVRHRQGLNDIHVPGSWEAADIAWARRRAGAYGSPVSFEVSPWLGLCHVRLHVPVETGHGDGRQRPVSRPRPPDVLLARTRMLWNTYVAQIDLGRLKLRARPLDLLRRRPAWISRTSPR